MAIERPYYRTCRPFLNGRYSGHSVYIEHENYANSPEHYVRAYLVLLEDLKKLFDYIEPAYGNRLAYSFRTHELLLRTCVEVEANFKAILAENGFTKKGNLNINDYEKINSSHRLSSYKVKIPFWSGSKRIRRPFSTWGRGGALPWYQAYNEAKHDRPNAFQKATFDKVIDAMCGLLVVLSAQFYTHAFSPADPVLGLEGKGDGMEAGIGDYLGSNFQMIGPKRNATISI